MKSPAAICPDRVAFREMAQRGNLIPVYVDLIADAETPISAFRKLDEGGFTFLLESAEKNDQVGRFSFVGNEPRLIFRSRGCVVTVTESGDTREFVAEGDPLAELQKIMNRYRAVATDPNFAPFVGGAVGYLSFDTVRFFEPTVGPAPHDDLELPDTFFMISNGLLIFDHRARRLRILVNALIEGDGADCADAAYDRACAGIESLREKLAANVELAQINLFDRQRSISPASNTERAEFEKMVRDAKEYIHAGDIFQVVPSQRFEAPYSGDALDLYRALRFVNPSPYMFCIRFGNEFSLVGSSPEVHVRAIDGNVEIRPIAGTRPRGATEDEDEANARELLADPKERAEHLMLVDLARNDVGRIAEFGSVRVTDFMTIEKYSHVMHIVSNVVGSLKKGSNAYDVMRATFPAGTVSGSPKVRAMQIINSFEKNKRGAYAGAVAYFGFDGNLDSCIALRTIVLKDGKAYVQAGAGIVADSSPEAEFQETVNKAMGMMRAIEMAGGIGGNL
jgi:anthranilate synthase component 1